MAQLPLGDKTNGFQKALALGILGATVWGGIKLFNYIAPDVITLMKNIYWLIGLGTPLVLVSLYIISNPLVVWGFFKTLSWKLTAFLIKMDPLSVMDRYVDYLKKKLQALYITVNVLQGKKEKLDRRISILDGKIRENVKNGNAALKLEGPESNAASTFGVKVSTDKGTLKLLHPLQERIGKNLEFLQKLADNWKWGIEKLEYQISAKREEYEMIKETYKGLKTAEDFINSDSEAARNYGESLRALEENVTQKIGYIQEFERKSKDIMAGIDVERQVVKDEGLAALEEAMQDDNLRLGDFSVGAIQEVQYETVSSKVGTNSKFKFLNK